MHYWGYPYMMNWGFGGGVISFVLFILFWVFVAILIAAIVRGSRRHDYFKHDKFFEDKQENAKDILKERYAKGEISKKEYEEMKKTISD